MAGGHAVCGFGLAQTVAVIGISGCVLGDGSIDDFDKLRLWKVTSEPFP